MARTAPVPNIPAIPGMNPGLFVLGGGGDGGGSGAGGGSGSGGKQGAGGKNGGKDATGGGKSAPDPAKYPDCGTASHPVDVVTGRAYTHPLTDFQLAGPLPLEWVRVCSSTLAHRDVGLGWGWSHSLAWSIEVRRRSVLVWNDQGVPVSFAVPEPGEEILGPWGWALRRDGDSFVLDVDDGRIRRFAERVEGGYRLSSIEDRNQNRIALAYSGGRLSEVQDSAGRVVKIESTPQGRISAVRVLNAAAQGRWIDLVRYHYDEQGCLLEATDADGFSAHYGYDEDRRMTSDADRSGLTFHFVYDEQGRCIESWGNYPGRKDPSLGESVPRTLYDGHTRAKGIHHCKLEYSADGSTEVIDSTQVRRFFGNEHGLLDKSVEGGSVATATYRADGHQLSSTDPEGGVTLFERDPRGRPLKIVDQLGRVTEIERDAFGLPLKVTDPAGGVLTFTRDARGNALSQVGADGAVTSYRYDERGLVTEVTSPDGFVTRFSYDAHGNRISTTSPDGAVQHFRHDALGRCVERVEPSGARTVFVFSPRGDLVAIHDAGGGITSYRYDGEAHLLEVIRPPGRSTRFEWGGYHKLCSRTDANGNAVQLRYNLEGELLAVQNERGELHSFEYDPSGRLIGELTFDGRKTSYRNDLCGRLVQLTNGAGEVVSLTRDAAGQMVARELPDGAIEEFHYDACGRLERALGPDIEITLQRDAVGRVIRELQVVHGQSVEVTSTFGAGGERSERKTSLGHTEQVLRDAMGRRVRTLLDGQTELAHTRDAAGREIARLLPAGGKIESRYDELGRLAQRRVRTSQALPAAPGQPDWIGDERGVSADTAYHYDAAGELAERSDKGSGRTSYQHDPIGRLLSRVPEKARSEVFRYDSTGNLFEADAEKDGPARSYEKGGRLERRGGTRYSWNDCGQLTEKREVTASGEERAWQYEWNGAGLLERVTMPDGRKVELAYDPLARRLQKRVLSGGVEESATRFVWDGDVLVHEITRRAAESGDPIVEERTYCFEDDSFAPIAHRDGRGGSWVHYVNDMGGTPDRLADAGGEIVTALDRSAWGASAAPEPTAIGFQGQYKDRETGLSYNRLRYYSAEDARYISPDPLGLKATFQAWRYAPSPDRFIDPLGLEDVDPNAINFSQRTVGGETTKYEADMKGGKWDWDKSGPLRVMDVNGQLVSYDNRRLMAAQNAGQTTVPVQVVDPNAIMPGSKKTWAEAFKKRQCDPRNKAAGGVVPPEGVAEQPKVV